MLLYTNMIMKESCKNDEYYEKKSKIRYDNVYEFVQFNLKLIKK